MKKIIIAAIALFTIAGMTSCSKDYTCTCTYPSGSSVSNSNTTYKESKSKATSDCNAQNIIATASNGSCSLN